MVCFACIMYPLMYTGGAAFAGITAYFKPFHRQHSDVKAIENSTPEGVDSATQRNQSACGTHGWIWWMPKSFQRL